MRADRLLSLLLILQRKGLSSARDLAAALEVSERTIYRDIEALSSAGVPVYAQTGRNGGFALLESYRTDLTGLSESETRALYLALLAHNVPQPLVDLGVGSTLESALRKLSAALPQRFRLDEGQVRQRFVLDPTNWEGGPQASILSAVQQAVWGDRCLQIRYRTFSGSSAEQVVEPYGLVAKAGVWYLVYARKGHFQARRLSTLVAVSLLDDTFARSPDFNLPDFWEAWVVERQAQPPRFEVLARVKVDLVSLLPYALRQPFQRGIEGAGPVDDQGRVTISLRFDSFEDARARLLSLGRAVEVIEPLALRVVLRDYAEQVLSLYHE